MIIRDKSLLSQPDILTNSNAMAEINAIFHIAESILLASGKKRKDGWISLLEIPVELMLPPNEEQGVGSKMIFESGPSVDHPSYRGQYELVQEWLSENARAVGLLVNAILLESGNGTLRIVQPGINKATGLRTLHAEGRINLSTTIYAGDNLNDLPAANLVKQNGGLVVTVSNGHSDLKKIADIVSDEEVSDGIIDIFSHL